MKIHWTKCFLAVAFILMSSVLALDPARATEGVADEERSVWKAAAVAMSQEATRTRPPKTLYHKSDFGEASLMVSFAKDAIGGFCGLTGQAASAMSSELKAVNAQTIAFDETLVEGTGLKLTSKKESRRFYLALSRVVFDSTRERAWLAVDLNKVAGAVLRMDKIDGQWTKAAECGGWVTM
jgi:hypothetical protein